jgi:site-specific DNA recombinase
MTTAAIYVRVSTDRQDQEGTSLETQEAACRAYAAEHGWTVVGVWRDAYTGTEYRNRPGLTALRDTVRAGEADVVLCHALDRLSRNQDHIAILVDEIEHVGVRLDLVTEEFDETPTGRAVRNLLGFAAEVQRLKIIENTQRARRKRAQDGKFLPGKKPPFGYQWRDEKKSALAPDETQARIVRRIFAEAIAGGTLWSIAAGLNADRVPSPTGRATWCPTTVRYILGDERYAGRAYSHTTRKERIKGTTKYRRTVLPREQWIRLPDGVVPALVGEAEYAAVAARLRANQAQSTRNQRNPEDFLLRAGFVRCGECGRAMAAHNRKTGERFYSCTKDRTRPGQSCPGVSVSARRLDAAVWRHIKAELSERGRIRESLERMIGEDPTQADVAVIDRMLADVTKQQANVARTAALIEDADAAAPLAAHLEELGRRKRALEAERSVVLAQRSEWEAARARITEIEAWCEAVAAELDGLDYSGRRRVLTDLGVCASVTRDGVSLTAAGLGQIVNIPACEIVWCGARNGRVRTRGEPAGRRPATL